LDAFAEAERDAAVCADDAGCCFQNGSGVVLEDAEELGRLEEKQTGACRLEPGIRFEIGGDQRGLLKPFTESNGSSSAIAMQTSTAW
jgi:orotidine-5'-phosphate decarboxylase